MKFLSAEWRKLAIVNYEISPEILEPYLPENVELDFWNGKCIVSLVGFMFLNTKLLGFSVPFHKNFEEVNLRFYVKRNDDGNWKRGVVFIKEIVPKKMLSLVANTFYNENYQTLPMQHDIKNNDNRLQVNYFWKSKNWNEIEITAKNQLHEMIQNSDFEFITEHYFGYTKIRNQTSEYEVKHPKWKYYEVFDFKINVHFDEVYGANFQFLNQQKPLSVMLAEGSEIEVFTMKTCKKTPEDLRSSIFPKKQ